MWKESLPATLVMYLLAQIRAASRASDEICWYSSESK